jgi:hypothetical protein
MIMKQFMIAFRNLKNNLPLDTFFNARTMSDALSEAEKLCKRVEKYGIKLEVTSIFEVDDEY